MSIRELHEGSLRSWRRTLLVSFLCQNIWDIQRKVLFCLVVSVHGCLALLFLGSCQDRMYCWEIMVEKKVFTSSTLRRRCSVPNSPGKEHDFRDLSSFYYTKPSLLQVPLSLNSVHTGGLQDECLGRKYRTWIRIAQLCMCVSFALGIPSSSSSRPLLLHEGASICLVIAFWYFSLALPQSK